MQSEEKTASAVGMPEPLVGRAARWQRRTEELGLQPVGPALGDVDGAVGQRVLGPVGRGRRSVAQFAPSVGRSKRHSTVAPVSQAARARVRLCVRSRGCTSIVVGLRPGRAPSSAVAPRAGRATRVAIIDKNRRAFRRLPDDWPGRTVVGFGFDRDHLAEAGVDDAAALAAVTSGDNSNILTARIARETFQIPHVVARIYDPRRALIYQRLGIPTVATVPWTTDQVMRRLFPERVA